MLADIQIKYHFNVDMRTVFHNNNFSIKAVTVQTSYVPPKISEHMI